jgi:tryptophanyl-tRNA synthetase
VKRALTGIKPTGSPHLGNLLGAIRPALRLADDGFEALYFIADYHALTTVHDADRLAHLTREVAATWLALGLDPERAVLYRQSDIPEIFELAWVLACFMPKSWMDRSHAYKAAVDANRERGLEDLDAGVHMGTYGYPILMAADILAFDVDLVPVGKDQVQHLEIARDIAQRVNHVCGTDVLRLPTAKVDDRAAIVPGLDGRKMSKSYDNTIPLFATPKQLKKIVGAIVTDSSLPEAPKDPDTSTVFQIFRAIAPADVTAEFAARLRSGIGWGDAKAALYDQLEAVLGPARAKYEALIATPGQLDELLSMGADRARPIAQRVLDRVRHAVGTWRCSWTPWQP